MYLHVRIYVGMYGHVAHTGVDAYVCPGRCRAHRWVHVHSIAIHSSTYIMYMGIHPYLDTCISERRRGARVGVRMRVRVRARVRPRGLTSALGYNRRSERTGVPITRMRVCVRACAVSFPVASARSSPRPPIGARRARAARARGARQAHLLHEGQGAPRLARPVQALGGTVRPAPAATAVRVCGGAGNALLRVALPRRAGTARRWRRRRRRCRSSAGRRARARNGWRPRPTGARSGVGPEPPGAAAPVGAQGRVNRRARGAAGGGRLAQPDRTVSAAAAALTRRRRCADAGSGGS
jgi:hypothetical protein